MIAPDNFGGAHTVSIFANLIREVSAGTLHAGLLGLDRDHQTRTRRERRFRTGFTHWKDRGHNGNKDDIRISTNSIVSTGSNSYSYPLAEIV